MAEGTDWQVEYHTRELKKALGPQYLVEIKPTGYVANTGVVTARYFLEGCRECLHNKKGVCALRRFSPLDAWVAGGRAECTDHERVPPGLLRRLGKGLGLC